MKRTTMILIGFLVVWAMGCDRDDRRVEPDRGHHRRHVSEVGIRGVVVDQDGRAIAHHAVQFVHKDQVWRGLTDEEGRYVFVDLPSEYEGRVVVFYEDREFSERIRLPRRGYEQCEMRIRRPHRHHKPVTPRRHYCEVTGRVYQGRHAQPKTEVVLQIRGQRDRTTRTDKYGRYTFNYVPLEQRGRISIQRPGAQGSITIYTGNRPGEVRVDKLYIEPLPAPTPHRHADHRDGHLPPDAPAHRTQSREERRAEERRQRERDRAQAEEAARLRKQQEARAKAYRQQRERERQQAAELKRQEEEQEARKARRKQARQREAAAAELKRQEEKKEARRKQQEHAKKRAAIEAHLQKQRDLKKAHQERIDQAMKKIAEARARQQKHRREEEEKAEEPVKKQRPGRQRRKSEPKPEPTPEVTPQPAPEPVPAAEPEEDPPATRRSRRRRS